MINKQPSKRITALYARLSRDDEKNSTSGSILNQKEILEKYAKDNNLPNPRFFYDDGFSGVTFTRPAFIEIMELAEQGLVENLVVKDHSRLGRNRLVVGQLLEYDFVRLKIRYIAIMDNIDTANGISDVVPLHDYFNEWHAKNTSDKVRKVMQSKGMAGKPLTTNPPFGYKKVEGTKDVWEIDETAAEIVRKIFRLCVAGLGPTQIAKRLRSEKVLTPTEYWMSIGKKCSHPPAIPFGWVADTVSNILDKQEYCGDTVNFRSTSASFKDKKKIEKPKEEWMVFEDTHPAIIDRETFELVQQLRSNRRRPTKSGIRSMFSGLVYCADCGKKLYYSVTGNYKREQANFFCSSYRKNSEVCSAHFIREAVIETLVLENMQRVLWYVQSFEKAFAEKQLEAFGVKHKREVLEKQRHLEKVQFRIKEIDGIIQQLYEDILSGKIKNERFEIMSESLEREQAELKESVPELEENLENAKIKTEGIDKFIANAKRLTRLTELTPEVVNEFIEKIVVGKPIRIDGKRYQDIDIYYNGIGIISEPTAEEMEVAFQEHLKQRSNKKAKTA